MRDKIDYVFFDVGDTLLKKETSINERLAEVLNLETKKLKNKKEGLIKNLPGKLEKKFNNIRKLEDQIEYFRAFYRLLCKRLGLEATEKRIRLMLDCRLNEEMVLIEDCIPEVLENLKQEGYELGIITNAFPSRRYFDLKTASLKDYFDPIMITSEEGLSKRNSEIYEVALKRAGVSPKRTMFIDNKLTYLRTAQEMNIKHLVLADRKKEYEKGDLNSIKIIRSIQELRNNF